MNRMICIKSEKSKYVNHDRIHYFLFHSWYVPIKYSVVNLISRIELITSNKALTFQIAFIRIVFSFNLLSVKNTPPPFLYACERLYPSDSVVVVFFLY